MSLYLILFYFFYRNSYFKNRYCELELSLLFWKTPSPPVLHQCSCVPAASFTLHCAPDYFYAVESGGEIQVISAGSAASTAQPSALRGLIVPFPDSSLQR